MNNLTLKVAIGEKEKTQPKMHLLHRGRHGRDFQKWKLVYLRTSKDLPLYLDLMEKSPSPPQNQYRWRSPLSLHRILVKHGLTHSPYMASPKSNPHRRVPNRMQQSNLGRLANKVYGILVVLIPTPSYKAKYNDRFLRN